MPTTYTIDVENQLILDPGTESELNLTLLGLECSACARRFPSCGSIRPGSDCPVLIPALHLQMVAAKQPATPLQTA